MPLPRPTITATGRYRAEMFSECLHRKNVYRENVYRENVYRENVYRENVYRENVYRDVCNQLNN